MDSLTQIRLTRELIDIDSTTPNEIQAGEFIARMLEGLGYAVTRQPVVDGRFNVIARTSAEPVVVFSTHFDCVPPFFSSREAGGRVYGPRRLRCERHPAGTGRGGRKAARRRRATDRPVVCGGRGAGQRGRADGEHGGAGLYALPY